MTTVDSASDLFRGEGDELTGWQGAWILFVFFFCLFAIDSSTVREWIALELGGPEYRSIDNPPFYFIQKDVIHGISAGIALLSIWTFTLFTRRYSRYFTFMAQWMSLLFLGTYVTRAIYVWSRCDKLFTAQATCPWPTLDAYLDNPSYGLTSYGTLVIVSAFVLFGNHRLYKHRAGTQ